MLDIDGLKIRGGRNIALKIPDHSYSQTVAFYRDVLKLPQVERQDGQVCFRFDDRQPFTYLWLDKAEGSARPDVWLELNTDNVEQAKRYLQSMGGTVPSHLERLPDGFKGFWFVDPAGLVYLVSLHGE
ncbi:VOC family protein [Methylocystis sp.]|uniref:VOC family protein n=1 Tax=Methylocystis sp. TaxID=1911079 RepID=UPI003DA6CDA7